MNQTDPDLLVRLSDAPRLVARITGERPHKSVIYRWASRGLRNVKLQTAFAGGYRRTSWRWLLEFFAEVTAAADGKSRPQIDTAARRAKEIATAEQELSRHGI